MNDKFEELHLKQFTLDWIYHGCGYWSVCLEHDCPCTRVNQGFDNELWKQMFTSKMITISEEFKTIRKIMSN